MKKEELLPLLCRDRIFKSIFTMYQDVLKIFIYDITGIKLNNLQISMNELPITRKDEKFKVCDLVITDDNYIIDIELNSSYSKTLIIKNTSYIFNLFASHCDKGKKYSTRLQVIQININYFSRFNKPVLSYQLLNQKYDKLYLNNFKIYDLDIVKSNEIYYNDKEKPQWDALLNKAIKGYARVETRSYDAFAENGEKTSTETIYYDKKGNRLASVFNVRSKSGNHNSIKTADAEYFDWDMDGNIDCKDFKITGKHANYWKDLSILLD